VIEGRATAKYVRTSAQKAKLVIDLIRGKDVDNALATLRFARKGVAKDVEKVLRSAIANAQQKQGAGDEVERLYVRECYADQGPTLKRIRAAPMGRAFRILKRTSHLTVIVGERPEGQASRSRRGRGGSDGTGGAGRRLRRRTAALRAPVTTPEPEILEPDTTPEVDAPEPETTPEPELTPESPVAEVTETDAVPESGEPEASEPPESDAPPGPEDESDLAEERPEPDEKPEPDEPDEEPPTLPPGGILGIR